MKSLNQLLYIEILYDALWYLRALPNKLKIFQTIILL